MAAKRRVIRDSVISVLNWGREGGGKRRVADDRRMGELLAGCFAWLLSVGLREF